MSRGADPNTLESRRAVLCTLVSLPASAECLLTRFVKANTLISSADSNWGTVRGGLIDRLGQPVAAAFVWLESASTEGAQELAVHPQLQARSANELQLEFTDAGFLPSRIGVQAGQSLRIRNSTAEEQSLVWAGHPQHNPGGETSLPPGGELVLNHFQPDRFPIRFVSALQPALTSWLRVFAHPYFTLTDAHGQFDLQLVPPGPCRILAWHPATGWHGDAHGRPIVVAKKEVTDLKTLAGN